MWPLELHARGADTTNVLMRLRMRLRAEDGFGLLELLIAMTVLNVGILAVVSAFNVGFVSLRRASLTSTAAVLADQQMELYRALTYDQIALDSTALAATNSTYKCDQALGTGTCPYSTSGEVTRSCSGSPNECLPWRGPVTGPDRHTYYVATYILTENPTASSRTVKRVTVVVRDGRDTNKVWARETSTFDCSTGQPSSNCPTSGRAGARV